MVETAEEKCGCARLLLHLLRVLELDLRAQLVSGVLGEREQQREHLADVVQVVVQLVQTLDSAQADARLGGVRSRV